MAIMMPCGGFLLSIVPPSTFHHDDDLVKYGGTGLLVYLPSPQHTFYTKRYGMLVNARNGVGMQWGLRGCPSSVIFVALYIIISLLTHMNCLGQKRKNPQAS
jgi:hypothetical protein